jgi:hypothetical protein
VGSQRASGGPPYYGLGLPIILVLRSIDATDPGHRTTDTALLRCATGDTAPRAGEPLRWSGDDLLTSAARVTELSSHGTPERHHPAVHRHRACRGGSGRGGRSPHRRARTTARHQPAHWHRGPPRPSHRPVDGTAPILCEALKHQRSADTLPVGGRRRSHSVPPSKPSGSTTGRTNTATTARSHPTITNSTTIGCRGGCSSRSLQIPDKQSRLVSSVGTLDTRQGNGPARRGT